MARITVEIPIRLFKKETAIKIEDFFRDITLPWVFCKKETLFFSTVKTNRKLQNTYKHEIVVIQRLLKLFPNNEKIKADLIKYQEKANKDWVYDVVVSFDGEIAAEIDIEDNSVLHYTGPINKNITPRDIPKLKKLIESDRLDEFYEEKIKKFILCIIMTCILTDPSIEIGCGKINLLIDGEKYCSKMFLTAPMHTDAFGEFHSFMTTKLSFEQTFSWIKQYTNLHKETQKPPVAFTALTYVLNREEHESLLYSVIGLESIYTPGSKGISYALQHRINHVFPSVTKEQVKDIYNKRSKFVHGEPKMNIYEDNTDILNGVFQFDEEPILAIALLIESIRILIANNSSKIVFDEQITHQFQ